MHAHTHTCSQICVLLPTNSDPACLESFAAPLQDHFIPTNSLLWWLNISPVQGINYWAVEHRKGAWLGDQAEEGARLLGLLAGSVAAVLAAECKTKEFQASSFPSPAPEQSRGVLRGLANWSPGWAREQLPPWLRWTLELLREAKEPPTTLFSPSL